MIARGIARVVFHSDWPLSKIGWKGAHSVANTLAWRFAGKPSGHPLWRLNNWVARHWTTWWVRRAVER